MIKENLVEYFEQSIKSNWESLALSDYKGEGLTYGEVAKKIEKIHILFESGGIKKGDKIALIGKNSTHWAAAFLATVCYGAVIVPILPDFKPKDVHYIVNHSDSKILFVTEPIWSSLDVEEMKSLQEVILLESFTMDFARSAKIEKTAVNLEKLCQEKYSNGLSPELFNLPEVTNDSLAAINYTSGTTGFSKGVMLTHNNLASNVRFAQNNMPLNSGDSIVSFLPLAHAYGMAFEFLFPFSIGCHITFLTKTPSP